MWIPGTEDEILQALATSQLEESAVFDAKRELPTQSRNVEIAKDVAAMANDGGVLIYGIGEDAAGRLTVPQPFPLAGQPERIDQVVRSAIAEPLTVRIHSIPTTADPAQGYIVVVVPPSERAPHMVMIKGENRFYGRKATGNEPLTEGEVARLYDRRRQWEVDREVLLAQGIGRAPLQARSGYAYLHIFVRPVYRDETLVGRIATPGEPLRRGLSEIVNWASQPAIRHRDYSPDFAELQKWRRHADGWTVMSCEPGQAQDKVNPRQALSIQLDFDGSGNLFCGRAAEKMESAFWFFAPIVMGNTTRFLALLGRLYDVSRYLGMVDIALAITGLRGAVPYRQGRYGQLPPPYDQDDYRRTHRVDAYALLSDPNEMAGRLLEPLLMAISQGKLEPGWL